MKEPGNDNQIEMFSETGSAYKQKNDSGNMFVSCLRGHEKIVILIISFILIGAFSFSLGVERGKKIASFQTNNIRIETAAAATQAAPILKQKEMLRNKPDDENKNMLASLTPPSTAQNKKEEFLINASEKLGRYTIQLASYKNNSAAQKEAQKLKSNGHTTLILTKGNYIILCVGDFANKEIAKTKLSELKKKYRDGIIRRL